MKSIVTLVILFISSMVQAQIPSEVAMKAKIKSEYQGVSSIKITGNGGVEKVFEDGVWKYYYKRPFEASFHNPEYPRVTGVILGTIRYIKAGNQYVFNTFLSSGTRMEGVKNPDKEEVLKIIHTDLPKFLGYHYNDVIGEISEIIIPKDVTYSWDDLKHVEFNVQVIFTKKISSTQVQKTKYTYELHLYSDGYKKPWNNFMAFEDDYKREIISTQTLASEEMAKLKTLTEIEEQKQVEKALSSLPKVDDAPVFKSDKQLFYYIHEKIMSATPTTAKAYIYSVLSKDNFASGFVLKPRVHEWIDKLINNINSYQYTYCAYPKIQSEQEGQLSFYDKELTKYVRYVGTQEGDTWKLREIVFYLPSQDKINRCVGITGSCSEKPDLTLKEKHLYRIGDIVDVQFSNGTYAAEVTKKDTNFENRYYVSLLDDGHGYWVTDDTMSPSNAKKVSFEVGDHIGIKQRSGTLLYGTILEIRGAEYLIKFDEEGYQDMWLPKQQLTNIN